MTDDRIYNAIPKRLSTSSPKHARRTALIVVGHNPSLHDLALQLIASGDVKPREQFNEKLPTSGFVVIDLPIDDWSAFVLAREDWSASSHHA